jgi:hypothetical protein
MKECPTRSRVTPSPWVCGNRDSAPKKVIEIVYDVMEAIAAGMRALLVMPLL